MGKALDYFNNHRKEKQSGASSRNSSAVKSNYSHGSALDYYKSKSPTYQAEQISSTINDELNSLMTDINNANTAPKWDTDYNSLRARVGGVQKKLSVLRDAYSVRGMDTSEIDDIYNLFEEQNSILENNGKWKASFATEEDFKEAMRYSTLNNKYEKLSYAKIMDDAAKLETSGYNNIPLKEREIMTGVRGGGGKVEKNDYFDDEEQQAKYLRKIAASKATLEELDTRTIEINNEIDELYANWRSGNPSISDEEYTKRINRLNEEKKQIQSYWIREKEKEADEAKHYKKDAEYRKLDTNLDFEEESQFRGIIPENDYNPESGVKPFGETISKLLSDVQDEKSNSKWTPEELKRLVYLYNTEGAWGAWEAERYYNFMQDTIEARKKEDFVADLDRALGLSGLTGASAVAKDVVYTIGTVGTILPRALEGVMSLGGVDVPDGEIPTMTEMTNLIRADVTKDMSETGKFFYNIGTNIADMVASAVVGGVIAKVAGFASGASGASTLFGKAKDYISAGEKITRAIIASSAASSTIENARQRGLSEDQSLLLGFVSAAAEYITESIGMEALLGDPKNVFLYILKNAGAEGTEEVLASIANTLGDGLIAGGDSEIRVRMSELMARGGMNEKEAFATAFTEWAKQTGLEALAGAISGVVFGLGGAIANQIKFSETGGKLNPTNAEGVDKEAKIASTKMYLESIIQNLEEGAITKRAQKALDDITNGKKVSNTELGYIVNKATESLVNEGKAELAEEISQISAIAGVVTKERNRIADNSANLDELISIAANEDRASDVAAQRILSNEMMMGELRGISGLDFYGDEAENVEAIKAFAKSYSIGAKSKGATVEIDPRDIGDIKAVNSDGEVIVDTPKGEMPVSSLILPAETAQIYNAASNYSTEGARVFVENYLDQPLDMPSGVSIGTYTNAFNKLYAWGKQGVTWAEARENASAFVDQIGETSAYAAFMGGSRFASRSKAESKAPVIKKKGEGNVKGEAQNENIDTVVQAVAKTLGVDVEISGDIASGAQFIASVGKIVIAEGARDQYTSLLHEVGEFTDVFNHSEAVAVRDAVLNWYAKKNGADSLDSLISKYQGVYKQGEGTKTYDSARTELFNDALGALFATEDGAEQFVEWLDGNVSESQKKTILDKLVEFINKIIDAIDSVIRNAKLNKTQQSFLEMEADLANKVRAQFLDALSGAVENYNAAEIVDDGDVVMKGDTVLAVRENGEIRNNIESWEDGGRDFLVGELDKNVKKKKLSQEDADSIIAQMDDAYDTAVMFKDKFGHFGSWSEAKVIRDENGKPVFSVVVGNAEYKYNLDFSTVCKKRTALDKVLNRIASEWTADDISNLTDADIAKLNQIIKKHDFEIACALCYVDAKRYVIGKWAGTFAQKYNELVRSLYKRKQAPKLDIRGNAKVSEGELDFTEVDKILDGFNARKKNSPKAQMTVEEKIANYLKTDATSRGIFSVGDLISSDGFDALRINRPKLYSIVNSHWGVGKPKNSHANRPYASEVIRTWSRLTAKRAFAVGGVRMKSFSDFQARMFFDYMQMFADIAAKGLPVQTYTKELLFARLFGLTGAKINLSAIPSVNLTEEESKYIESLSGLSKAEKEADSRYKMLKDRAGLDAYGDYAWADESINVDEAIELQRTEGYTSNLGIIAVGVSDAHIRKLLADPNIRMVIPYHASSLNHIVASMNKIDLFNDYTDHQRTYDGATAVKKDFDFYGDLAKTQDARTTADNYRAWCKEHGYTPKFSQFAGDTNYYKLLIDFNTYDTVTEESAMQKAVETVYPENYGAILSEALAKEGETLARLDAETSEIVDEFRNVIQDEGIRNQIEVDDEADLSLGADEALKQAQVDFIEEMKQTIDPNSRVLPSAARVNAQEWIAEYKSSYSLESLTNDLTQLYKMIGRNENYSVIENYARTVAERVVSNSGNRESATDAEQTIYNELLNVPIRATKGQIAAVEEYYGISFDQFKERTSLAFAETGIGAARRYDQLASEHPEMFAELDNTDNAVLYMAEAANDVRDRFSGVLRVSDEASILGAEMTFSYADLALTETAADRIVKRERDKYSVRVQKIRNGYEKRLQKKNEALSRVRANRDEKLAAQGAKYRARIDEMRRKKKADNYVRRIDRIVKDFDKRILRESDKKYIPEGMKKTVAKIVKTFAGTELFSHRDTAQMLSLYDSVLRKTKDDLGEYKTYAEEIDAALKIIEEVFIDNEGNTLRNFDVLSLEQLTEQLSEIKHIISDAETLRKGARKEELNDIVEEIKADVRTKRASSRREKGVGAVWEKLVIKGQMTPEYFFQELPSSFKEYVYDRLVEGQDHYGRIIKEARSVVKAAKDRYGYTNKWGKENIEVVLGGETRLMSAEQLMSLAAIYEREQSDPIQQSQHLLEGGINFEEDFVVTKDKKVEVKANATKVTQLEVETAIAKLTDDQRDYKNDLVQYMSSVLSEYGNEVTIELFGIRKFGQKLYFPYKLSENYKHTLASEPEKQTGINFSWTHSTVKRAATPVVVGSFTEIVGNHSNEMATYSAFKIPIDNMNKILGWQDRESSESMRAIIKNAYGSATLDYINQFMQDLSGGAISIDSRDTFIKKLLGNFRKTAIGFSSTVVLQQHPTVYRAMAEINPIYFIGADFKSLSPNVYKEMLERAPIALIKQIGGFDTMGALGAVDWITNSKSFTDYVDDVVGFLPSLMDKLAWAQIWGAAKAETNAKINKGALSLEIGSDEYFEYVNERFRTVINRTQVYNSVLSKSHTMRNKSVAGKMVTSFMAEPTLIFNMLWLNKQNLKGKLRTVMAVFASQIAGSMLRALAAAARDDDEDKTYWGKWASHTNSNFVSNINPVNSIPLISQLMSLVDGYSVTNPAFDGYERLVDSLAYFPSEGTAEEQGWAITEIAGYIGNLYGIPAANIIREIKAFVNLTTNMDYSKGDIVGDIKGGLREGWEENIGGLYNLVKPLDAIPGLERFIDDNTTTKGRIDAAWEDVQANDLTSAKGLAEALVSEAEEKRERKYPNEKTSERNRKAKTSARSAITSFFKQKYLEARENENYDTIYSIREFLRVTGLYGNVAETLNDWWSDYKDEQKLK